MFDEIITSKFPFLIIIINFNKKSTSFQVTKTSTFNRISSTKNTEQSVDLQFIKDKKPQENNLRAFDTHLIFFYSSRSHRPFAFMNAANCGRRKVYKSPFVLTASKDT